MKTLQYWLRGIRFYIAIGSGLVTILVLWWAETSYSGGPLVAIRAQETFAWLATGLLALAITIGPVYKLMPRLPGKQLLFDARRLIGISAAWFATLHVGTAYIVQFKAANPFVLPGNYRTAFALGVGALIILLAMAFTSFDKAFHAMGIWWFRLHRFVYVAVLLLLLHIFMIGVHAMELPVLFILTGISTLLVSAHVVISVKFRRISVWQAVTLSLTVLSLVAILQYGFTHRQQYPVAAVQKVQAQS